jgi:hypothetical protein
MAAGGHEEQRFTSEEVADMLVAAIERVVDLSPERRAEVLSDARDEIAKAAEQLDEMPPTSVLISALQSLAKD